jgi:uncharacterized membrane protein YfhO
MRGGGYVVLADTYYPGWRAAVDGVPAPIYAANGTFRAVFVEDGSHRVEFDYEPRGVRVGAAVTFASLALVLALALASRAKTH